jgi:hypothetical protein
MLETGLSVLLKRPASFRTATPIPPAIRNRHPPTPNTDSTTRHIRAARPPGRIPRYSTEDGKV